jgi:4-amino-4-deoxy-L-arabinose transferase-like glycosyltransferase
MLATLATPAVNRTQEARVLETAREMLGAPLRGWFIPHLNGALRLQKPPLAYWMAAGSFELFGVSEGTGRVPFALVGWLALGLTYLFAREMFGRRAGVLSAAALMGGMLFARHYQLAETDVLVLGTVEAAAYSMWRAIGTRPASKLWLHATFAAIGLTAIGKGMPFAFPLLMFVALCVLLRRGDVLLSAVTSGAILTALFIALPWYAYVLKTQGLQTLLYEMRAAAEGAGHKGTFLVYIPDLLTGLAPWTVIACAAFGLALSSRRYRRDRRVRLLLTWAAAVFVPLCFAGQKQKHYLLPLLPSIAILTGWYLDRLTGIVATRARRTGGVKPVLLATAIACAAFAVATPIVGKLIRGHPHWSDYVAAAVAMIASVTAMRHAVQNRLAHAANVFAAYAALGLPLLMTLWTSTFYEMTPNKLADVARRDLGPRNYCFYQSYTLDVGFALRSVVPIARNGEELYPLLREDPKLVIIVRDQPKQTAKQVPPGFARRLLFRTDDGDVKFFEFVGTDPGVIRRAPGANQ